LGCRKARATSRLVSAELPVGWVANCETWKRDVAEPAEQLAGAERV